MIVAVSLPVVLDAVIVYVVVEEVDVGVPFIRPVPELILSPAGREGEIDQLVAVPPVFVGDSVLIAVFTSPTISEATKELLARIRAVLRRRAPEQSGGRIQMGDLILDADTHRVTFQNHPLKLGPTEFKLLHYLMGHAERVHSRAQLLDNVWGDHVYIEERTVDVHVKRLREALSHAGVMVETVRGAGYRLTAKPAMPIVSSQPSADRASA